MEIVVQVRVDQVCVGSSDLGRTEAGSIHILEFSLNLSHLLCHLDELIFVLFSQLGELINVLSRPNFQRNVHGEWVLDAELRQIPPIV